MFGKIRSVAKVSADSYFTGSWEAPSEQCSQPAKRSFFFCLLLSLFLGASAAHAKVGFSEVVTFGDSLTDNEALWVYYDNPKDLYGADPMEAVFKKGRSPKAGDTLTSYAIAGSTSDELEMQVLAYKASMAAGLRNKATLFNIEIGSNDILNNINLLAKNPPGAKRSADAVSKKIIANIQSAWSSLKKTHPKARFVFWTIPDVTLTPEHWGSYSSEEIASIQAHIQHANKSIIKLDRMSNVVVLDLYTVIQSIVSSPPVLYGQKLRIPPVSGGYGCIFADGLHPTAVSNAVIANCLIRLINEKWRDTIALYTGSQMARLAHIKKH